MALNQADLKIFRGLIPATGDEAGKSTIRVVRNHFEGSNRYGRPNAVTEDEQVFTGADAQQVMRYLIEAPGSNHELIFPVRGKTIKVRVFDEPWIDEHVSVRVGQQEGASPRSVDDHHAISTDGGSFLDICMHIGPRDDKLFDRGLAWLHVANPSEPVLSFIVLAGKHTPEELKEGFTRIAVRGEQILADLTTGMDNQLPRLGE
ncbi:MAG: hypothetical protein M1484_03150 [Patescibacteria group bacterium]|nr:hypothetical protein [Patescibacteria group bacterium]MCL5432060.1 hypothetical protein [Patescibacteria group bacterium]